MRTSFTWDEGTVSAAWDRPSGTASATLALTHGAGGDLDDPSLAALASRLAERGIAVVRFNLPYREAGRRLPGSPRTSEACWRAVLEAIRGEPGPVLIGGRSYGGRIASHVAAEGAPCDGLVLLAYPLHPPGKPERLRDAHLAEIRVPVLICQGTRDAFATGDLLRRTVEAMPRATLHEVDGADHSFRVRGRPPGDVADEVAEAVAAFIASVSSHPPNG